jgi:hypothetical protein
MVDISGIIRLELAHATDMFETPTVELGSEFGSTISGIETAIGELTADRVTAPVQLAIVLPTTEVTSDVGEKIGVSLRRYCAEHRRHNENQVRAMKRSGWRALRIGFPITLLGLVIVTFGANVMSNSDPVQDVVDIVGWVLAWLGLWYPFDKVLFYPYDLVQQNRALQQLEAATITIEPLPH